MPESRTPSPEVVSALLIFVTIFHALALILTSFRLWFRYHLRRLWWDDFWAALALLCDAVCMVAMWILSAPLDDPYINIEGLPTPAQSRSVHIISIWLNILFFTCTIWFARISIVFSVLRIIPPTRSVRIAAFGAGAVFASMWAYMIACKSVVCSMNKSWYHFLDLRCPMPTWLALSEVCTDALSDAILVALPLRLLWRVKLPPNQRIMVLSVFSTSILVSTVSVAHTAYLITPVPFTGGFTAGMEGAVSLIVCNLLVIVTFLYRVIRSGRDLTAGISDKGAEPSSSNCLTTVDLNLSGGTRLTSTTSTALTGTNVSSLMFASGTSNKDTTFGSITPTSGSVLPAMTVNTDANSPPITAKR